jgi:hypothetical protein
MSTLLQEAIVDATALREAALKNAEASVIEKYSTEVRSVLDTLLEQEEDPLALGDPMAADPMAADPMAADPMAADPMAAGAEGEVADDVPLGAADGEELCGCPEEGSDVKVSVDLDELQEAVDALREENRLNEELDFSAEDLEAFLAEYELDETITTGSDEIFGTQEDTPQTSGGGALAGSAAATEADTEALKSEEGVKEEIEIPDDLLDAILEKVTVDMGATLSGWAGRSAYDMKWEMEKEMAHRRGTKANDELEILKKAQEELVFENNQLSERNKQYKQAIEELKEGLQEVNISNARLLYTNRVLRNASLNERQKTKIAEAISQAGSVTEAKTIYETLQSAVPSQGKPGPQSLSEAITRPTSVIRATRQESQPNDLFLDRMQKLAGIK